MWMQTCWIFWMISLLRKGHNKYKKYRDYASIPITVKGVLYLLQHSLFVQRKPLELPVISKSFRDAQFRRSGKPPSDEGGVKDLFDF